MYVCTQVVWLTVIMCVCTQVVMADSHDVCTQVVMADSYNVCMYTGGDG